MIQTLKDISHQLERAGIGYMVIGSIAVAVYGIPRFTRDIVITVALTPDESALVMNAVGDKFKAITKDAEKFAVDTWTMPLEHKQTGVKVDIIFSITSVEREAIKAARKFQVDGISVRHIPPEHLLVQKIIAGRAIDLKDAAGILETQGKKIRMAKVERMIKNTGDETRNAEWMERWRELKRTV